MVTVVSSRSPVPPASAFPYLHAVAVNLNSESDLHPSLAMAPAEQSTSVFKALGSYADRIRENGGEAPAKSAGTSNSSSAAAASPAPTPTASGSKTKMSSTSTSEKPVEQVEDDGPWETVQSVRARTKQDKDRERDQDKGSNSRNWRDRPQEKKAGSSSKDVVAEAGSAGESKKATAPAASANGSAKNKRAASSAPTTRNGSESGKPAVSQTQVASSSTSKPATTTAGVPTKSAWSTPITSQRAAGPSTPAETTGVPPAKAQATPARSQTAPSSPSLNGTTVANSSIGDVASPNLSSDTYASSTPPTSAAAKEGEDENNSWRSRMTTKSSEKSQERKEKPGSVAATTPAAPAVAPKPAPPPTVNAWSARQQKASTSTSATSPPVVNGSSAGPTPASASSKAGESVSAPVTAARLQFGDVSPTTESSKTIPNGHVEEPVKIGGKKKKKDAASVVGGQALVMDASQWPDVASAQVVAAEAAKAEAKRQSKQAEEQAEEAAANKKPKWTPIPASELLAAADEAAAAAEANKRQTRKRGSKHGESSTSPAAKMAGLPSKPKKADGTKRSEIRLPPNPNGQVHKAGFKPTFGSVEPGTEGSVIEESAVSELDGEATIANGSASVPLSRQTSKSGQPQSPNRSLTDPSVPLEQAMRFANGPIKSQPMHQNATAPLPQAPFPPSTSGNLPRPPRGGRSSFSGRGGRGGHRGGRGGFDPSYAYTQGYGPGFNAAAAGWNYGSTAGQQPMFDPMQAQWYNMQMYGRGPMPPPPTPQTVVSGPLEPLRFYVLGQIEYYFSMQNLAMDFFLRQQMDTEGWISIAMIASFNRIRSLTPEVPLVKEMMEQSSLLEVQGDHVRLKGEDAKKWVLPDAKHSPFPTDPTPTPDESSTTDAASALAATPDIESIAAESVVSGLPDDLVEMEMDLGFGGMSDYKHQPGDVANALMKSAPTSGANTTSAASVGNGEDTTPGTSVVSEDKDKADR